MLCSSELPSVFPVKTLLILLSGWRHTGVQEAHFSISKILEGGQPRVVQCDRLRENSAKVFHALSLTTFHSLNRTEFSRNIQMG